MIEITNTQEMREYLTTNEAGVVEFSAQANVFLNDIGLAVTKTARLEEVARANRRQLHLC